MNDFKIGDIVKIKDKNHRGVVTEVIDQGCDELNFLRVKFDEPEHWNPVLCYMVDCELVGKKPLSVSEWHEIAIGLFGENAREWRFICPVCHTVQSGKDFIEAGVSKEDTQNSLAIECIGRWLPRDKTQKAFGDGKIKKGKACDYTGRGLFKLNPIAVLCEDSTVLNVFEFAGLNNE